MAVDENIIPEVQLQQLKAFVSMLKARPSMLHSPQLSFLKEYLISINAELPHVPDDSSNADTNEVLDSSESDYMEVEEEEKLDLDMEGVITDDNSDESQEMGDPLKAELGEEEMEAFNEKRSQAIGSISDGDLEASILLFTEAIKMNPHSAVVFAKRGSCYLKLNRPKACIKDCTRAIELNDNNAAAHKFRGRAHRLLGNFAEAAKDLRLACKIDYDEQASEWLKEVTPNAKKIEEHLRNIERKNEEREIAEKKERIAKAREANAKAAASAESKSMEDLIGGAGLGDLFSDPEMMAAFQDISKNPANFGKYKNNPKVAAFMSKMAGSMGGAGGMPGAPGGFPGMDHPKTNNGCKVPPGGSSVPSSTDDLD